MGGFIDLTGQRFSKLVALKPLGPNSNRGIVWQCLCDCGNECQRDGRNLRGGYTRSCGCLQKEQIRQLGKAKQKYARHIAPFKYKYLVYQNNARKNKREFMLTFEQFQELLERDCYYCGDKPKAQIDRRGTPFRANGIDRIDNDKGYLMDNCVSCCAVCNKMKEIMPAQDFMGQCQRVAQHQREKLALCKKVV